jgi:hypothetical protein
MVAVFFALAAPATVQAACTPRSTPGYETRVMNVLASGKDVWGNALLRAPGGPTFAAAKRYLRPLLYARARGGRPLTASGVYYVPLSIPSGPRGGEAVMLHVADGSRIYDQKVTRRSIALTVDGEAYGRCLTRLTPARLADGWLPILQTAYRSRAGIRYAQESFSTGRESFIRLTVTTRARQAHIRFTPGRSYTVGARRTATIFVVWPAFRQVAEAAYEEKRRAIADYWRARLRLGASLVVPERAVMDAQRALLVQNLSLTYRYSIGNAYEQFSFPEGVDAARVMAEYGYGPTARSILRTALTRRSVPYPSWKMGEKLLGSAVYYRLLRDEKYIRLATPVLRHSVAWLRAKLTPRRLLGRERYSSDIRAKVYGLHAQAVVWQGLRGMAEVWSDLGDERDAAQATALADRLERGLRLAVRTSQRRLRDGSLFIPVRLLEKGHPELLTASRGGSYWNLVMPYALASGLFAPGSPQARGVLRFMATHGSRLLGMVRASGFSLYDDPVFPVSGTDGAYGVNVSRFLADNDEAEQLVLSLYGQLAAGMTQGTFVAGEGHTVAPLGGLSDRAMYLPPNSASNAAFLVTLRSMLVHEVAGGLRLAYATPRAWLAPGKRIEVRRVPTSFGVLAYTLEARAADILVTIDVPPRATKVSLRLRLPEATKTFDLSGRSGTVTFSVSRAQRRESSPVPSTSRSLREAQELRVSGSNPQQTPRCDAVAKSSSREP